VALRNVLTLPDAPAALPAPPDGFEGVRVVYADDNTVSPDRMKAEGAVFRQILYPSRIKDIDDVDFSTGSSDLMTAPIW